MPAFPALKSQSHISCLVAEVHGIEGLESVMMQSPPVHCSFCLLFLLKSGSEASAVRLCASPGAKKGLGLEFAPPRKIQTLGKALAQ